MAFVGACSDPPSRPPPGGEGEIKPPPTAARREAGATDSSTVDGGEAGVCNEIQTTGSVVDRIGVVGEPPVSTGGTIIDGTYELSVYAVYVGAGGVAGPTGITAKASLLIAGGRFDDVLELGGSGKTTSTTRTNSAYAITGASLASTELCPRVGGGKTRQFTATDSSVVLTDLTTKEAFTFVKR